MLDRGPGRSTLSTSVLAHRQEGRRFRMVSRLCRLVSPVAAPFPCSLRQCPAAFWLTCSACLWRRLFVPLESSAGEPLRYLSALHTRPRANGCPCLGAGRGPSVVPRSSKPAPQSARTTVNVPVPCLRRLIAPVAVHNTCFHHGGPSSALHLVSPASHYLVRLRPKRLALQRLSRIGQQPERCIRGCCPPFLCSSISSRHSATSHEHFLLVCSGTYSSYSLNGACNR